MWKICLRRVGLSFGSLLLLGLAECGGTGDSRSTDSPGSSGASAAGGGSAGAAVASGGSGVASAEPVCDVPSAAGYEPDWTPPSPPMPGACTQQQAAQQWALCEATSGMFNKQACRAFDVDPANSACLSCMFGALGQASAGAILVLPGGQWFANRTGCMALVDGDSSQTSCGASTQAADYLRVHGLPRGMYATCT